MEARLIESSLIEARLIESRLKLNEAEAETEAECTVYVKVTKPYEGVHSGACERSGSRPGA